MKSQESKDASSTNLRPGGAESGSPLGPLSSTPPAIPDHELLHRIGSGSYGEVWLARSATGSLRAVKVVYRKSFDHDRPYEREFEGLKKFEPLSHARESQVDIFHVGRNDSAGFFYYIMELADPAENPKPECQNPKETRNPNAETDTAKDKLRTSGFELPSSFDIRHSDLYTPRTLKYDLRTRGALPVAECLQIALALTRALEHLHKHGLVHRDIKPSNIIFVNGVPKLADIGLVTSVDATRSFVGTDGYIPPEGPGAPAGDLYSLGKVLYEAITGKDRLDFPELPADWRTRPDFDQLLEFNEILTKACDGDPGQRYQSAKEIAADLVRLRQGQSVKHRLAAERRIALAKRFSVPAAALAVLGMCIWLLLTRFNGTTLERSNPPTTKATTIAVLPFDNVSPDTADEYLGTSIATEISTSLSKIPGLRVIGQSSALALKQTKDRRAATHAVKLQALLEGTIRKTGNQLYLTAQLVNAADGFVVWSETYDRGVSEVFGIQTDIAERIAEKLHLEITDTVRTRLAIKPTKSLEAYQLYLEGRYAWVGGLGTTRELAMDRFQTAIRLDTNFAAAYAGLADCYIDATREIASGKEFFPKALENANRAVELSPDLSEAHTSLARVRCHYQYDWTGADKEFQLAIRLNPADAMARRWYSQYLDITGRFDEAIAQAKLATELDPFSASFRVSLAWNQFDAGRYETALEEFKKVLQRDENNDEALDGIGWCHAAQGSYDEAVSFWEKANQSSGLSPEKNAALTRAYQQVGLRGYWLKHIEQAKDGSNPSNMSPFWIAADYATLGEKDQVFDWLERAYADRTFYMPWLAVEYRFYSLHSDPRFAALLHKMGLQMPVWKK